MNCDGIKSQVKSFFSSVRENKLQNTKISNRSSVILQTVIQWNPLDSWHKLWLYVQYNIKIPQIPQFKCHFVYQLTLKYVLSSQNKGLGM